MVTVFAVVVVLYVGAVANGAGSGDGRAGGRPGGFVSWLGGLAGHPPAVARADLRADCLADATLTVKGGCVLTVSASSRNLREVRLHVNDAVAISSRAPRRDTVVRNNVKAGDDVRVTVDGKGGDIALECGGADRTAPSRDPAAPPCVVTLI